MILGQGSFISRGFDIAEDVEIGAGAQLTGNGRIDPGVRIGHGVIIEGEAHIGPGSIIGHHALITGRVRIGASNQVGHGTTIGGGPEHPDHLHSEGWVKIGDRNVFRERCTVNMPTTEPLTQIGSDNYFMHGVHVAHDCRVGNKVKFAPLITLAGHVEIDDYAYLGLHCAVHQRLHIGTLCMIGMMCGVRKNVPPFATLVPVGFSSLNLKGLQLRGYTEEEISQIASYYGFAPTSAPPATGESEGVSKIRRFLERHEAKATYLPTGIDR